MEDIVESGEEALENKKGRQNIKFVLNTNSVDENHISTFQFCFSSCKECP